MINEKQLELVWSHTLRTNASSSVVKDLLSVTADDFDWEAKPYGIETDTSATYISALINCISKNLLQIKSSEWESARETWMEVWKIVSKNKNNWKQSTWKTCTQSVRRENFDSNFSNVQEQILNDIPTKVWSDLTENELHAALKDALVNGDVGLVKKTIQFGVDLSKGHILRSQEYFDDGRQANVLTPNICVTKNLKCIAALLDAGASMDDDLQIVGKHEDGENCYNPIQSSWDFFMGEQNQDNCDMDASDRINAALLIVKTGIKRSENSQASLAYKNALIVKLIEDLPSNTTNKALLFKIMRDQEFLECFKLENKIKYGMNFYNFLAVTKPDLCGWFINSTRFNLDEAREFKDEYGFKMEHYAMMGMGGSLDAFNEIGKPHKELLEPLTNEEFLINLLRRTIEISNLGIFDKFLASVSNYKLAQPLAVMHNLIENGSDTDKLKINATMKKVCENFSFEDQFATIKMLGRLSSLSTKSGSFINHREIRWTNDQVLFKNLSNEVSINDYDAFQLTMCLELIDHINSSSMVEKIKTELCRILADRPKVWQALVELESGENSVVWNRDVFSGLKALESGAIWNSMKSAGEASVLKQIHGVSNNTKSAHVL